MTLVQAHLRFGREPLQIPYPEDFEGDKYDGGNTDFDDAEIYISTEPRFFTPDEIEVVQEYLKTLLYSQELIETGCIMIDEDDPLLEFDHDQLDALEQDQSLPQTRKPIGGGTRQLFERVLLIREYGYRGTGFKGLPGAKE
jgi:hypothetical protein